MYTPTSAPTVSTSRAHMHHVSQHWYTLCISIKLNLINVICIRLLYFVPIYSDLYLLLYYEPFKTLPYTFIPYLFTVSCICLLYLVSVYCILYLFTVSCICLLYLVSVYCILYLFTVFCICLLYFVSVYCIMYLFTVSCICLL